jgi:hypothetical protein
MKLNKRHPATGTGSAMGKQRPMTTFFAPLAAVNNPRSKPAKGASNRRAKDDVDEIRAATASDERVERLRSLPIATQSQSGWHSSDEDDSMCLAQLVAATKPKKENKTRKRTPSEAVKETRKRSSADPMQDNALEPPFATNAPLSLNDFGVWNVHEGITTKPKPVKVEKKQRLAGYGTNSCGRSISLRESAESMDEVCETIVPSLKAKQKSASGEEQPARTETRRQVRFETSKNIVHTLVHRSTRGTIANRYAVTIDSKAIAARNATTNDKKSIDNNEIKTTINYYTATSTREKLTRTRIPWSIPSWLRLVQHSGSHINSTSSVTKMAWDSMGVLLAVAYEGSAVSRGHPVVAIYDWDMVVAADRRGRSHLQRSGMQRESTSQDQGGIFVVEPVMTIPIPSKSRAPVTVLEWNPFCPDELVVGLRYVLHRCTRRVVRLSPIRLTQQCFLYAVKPRLSGSVYIFDLEAVGGWLDTYVRTGRSEGGLLPPCRELRCFEEGPRRLPGNVGGAVINHDASFCFLDDGQHAVLSAGTAVFCWFTGGGNWVPGIVNLLWKFQYKDTITAMAVLTHDTVVLGTCNGRLAVLNWKQVTRAAFSCKPSPTLIEDWVSYFAGPSQEQMEIPSAPLAMGIRNLRVIAERSVPGKLVQYRLVWVTSCGWVVSSALEVVSSPAEPKQAFTPEKHIRRRKGCEVHHTTKPIKWRSMDGEEVSLLTPTWTVPTKRLQVGTTGKALVWQKVDDDVTQVLPHHDQRVLGSEPSFEQRRYTKPKLQWMSMSPSYRGLGTERYPLRTIPISKRAGSPTGIAIHPGHEWIIVGTSQNGMYLINARSKVLSGARGCN